MKNKEIEELLNNIKSVYELNKPLTDKYKEDCMRFIINTKEAELLLSYIEQLEKIPNKALDFIHENSYKKGDGTIMYDTDIQKLENIIKGDSDE